MPLFRSWSAVTSVCLALFLAAPGLGQDRRNRPQRGPAVGDPLPALTGYDADGDTFEFSQLTGKHTVIVFGCLT